MVSHWPFGHLQPKLWAKERPGVKLAVWLSTTKSRESTCSRRALGECDTSFERSRWGLQYWLRPRLDPRSGRGVMAVQSPRSPTGTHSGQLRDSISGVPGKSDIRMPLPRANAEYTIGSKVVAVVCLVVQSARGLSTHLRVSRKCELTTLWFVLMQIQAWSTKPSS
jgi:hypothetical protein